jgi:hypothetical protein
MQSEHDKPDGDYQHSLLVSRAEEAALSSEKITAPLENFLCYIVIAR